jgi:hypothetical protein
MRDYHVYPINSPTGKIKDQGVALGIEDGCIICVFLPRTGTEFLESVNSQITLPVCLVNNAVL